MHPFFQRIISAISRIPLNIRENYDIVRKVQKVAKPGNRLFFDGLDYQLHTNEGRDIPVRIYSPRQDIGFDALSQERLSWDNVAEAARSARNPGLIMFIHGGGWVIGTIDTYHNMTAQLAIASGRLVVSIDYRLAPEHPFPAGLDDCLLAYRSLRQLSVDFGIDPDEITIMGDSAGGNLAAALCLLLKDLGEVQPRRQILLYPATGYDYSEHSEFPSVIENGYDYVLTSARIEEYLELYCPDPKLRKSPYIAPILADDLTGLPEALIFSCEFDPLRDEGEAYGKYLGDAGVASRVWRAQKALHGYMGSLLINKHVASTYITIARALGEEVLEELLDYYDSELITERYTSLETVNTKGKGIRPD